MNNHTNTAHIFPHFESIMNNIDNLPGHRILVLGDIMVDEYIWGEVVRISPEAPVPVVHVQNVTMQLGGAANVVHNLKALDAEVELVGVIGSDDLSRRILATLDRLQIGSSGIKLVQNRETIRKTRIIAHSQQVVRVDHEKILPLEPEIESFLIDYCLQKVKEVEAVIISDYAKGTLTKKLVQSVIQACRKTGKICAVDPRVKNHEFYVGCSVITPNHLEAALMTGISMDSNWEKALRQAGEQLLSTLATDAALVTCGERGLAIFLPNEPVQHIDTVAQSVFDVTGAGDTVISALTLGLTGGLSYSEAAVLANFAAGIVVGKVGTATVTLDEIKKAVRLYAR